MYGSLDLPHVSLRLALSPPLAPLGWPRGAQAAPPRRAMPMIDADDARSTGRQRGGMPQAGLLG
eukprot:CAMPEP_0183331438 /NCGR_PEP_ID=MMETSP0164_2-20130417/804_1 /TAXON_ID=221442 /ORGANISM="Coccolithus pelagicus ssp braarudi, Strain PLY182g" /LENGTH=63 /DNA_ID=CAMNT_0025499913 /DNA_START=1 /DNA_END=192 /DNA_ORIENTATION=+